MAKLRQAELRRPIKGGESVTVRWVPADTKAGDEVRLPGSTETWRAVTVYRFTIEADAIRRDWKVGGLE